MNILIVDDNQIYSELLISMIDNKKDNIFSVNNPLHALEILKNTKFDLVITEMIMNHMNGINFYNQVMKINKNIKVIIHSNVMNSNFEKLSKITGIYGYYNKPAFSAIKRDIEYIKNGIMYFNKSN